MGPSAAWASLVLMSLAAGLGNFAGGLGIALANPSRAIKLRVALAFGVFEATMPALGILFGRELAGRLGNAAQLCAAVALIVVGVYTAVKALRDDRKRKSHAQISTAAIWLTALALSTDNLAVGFALGLLPIALLLSLAVMASISVAMSAAGMEAGGRIQELFQARYRHNIHTWTEALGGAVLICVGIGLFVFAVA